RLGTEHGRVTPGAQLGETPRRRVGQPGDRPPQLGRVARDAGGLVGREAQVDDDVGRPTHAGSFAEVSAVSSGAEPAAEASRMAAAAKPIIPHSSATVCGNRWLK